MSVVESLRAYLVNSTCVLLIWTLSPQIYTITSFVIEWKHLNKEEELKWVRVPPNISQYYIYGECAFENMFIVMEQKDVALLSSHILFFPHSLMAFMVRTSRVILDYHQRTECHINNQVNKE